MFTQRHLYVTLQWNYANPSSEVGQVGIRFLRTTMPSPAERLSARTAFATWWTAATTKIPVTHRLAFAKYALVDPDGHYPPEFEPFVDDWAPPISGGGGAALFPLQVAQVASLRTGALRGKASKGRIYLPPINTALVNFRSPNTDVQLRAQRTAEMIAAVSTGLNAPAVVMSRIGAGTTREIEAVRVGDLPDVHRSRTRQLDDVYEEYAV